MTNQQRLFEKKMTREELAQYLWKAADVLRGPIEVSEYKNYILSLLFYKRLSDVFVEYTRQVGTNIGQKLNEALDSIAKANPELEGVINRTDFNDKEMKQAITYHIKVNIEKNPIYETLSQKLERILKEKDGGRLLESLKALIKEINETEDKAKRLNLCDEEYALFEVLKRHFPNIDEEKGVGFVKNLFGKVESELFSGWHEKEQVVLETEKKFFDGCFAEFFGKVSNRQIASMAEQMTTYLTKFDAWG